MDDLKHELDQDAELQDATRLLAERLSRADLEELQRAVESGNIEAIAKELDLQSVDQLEELVAFLGSRAEHYGRYPDLRQFRRR